MKGEVAGHGLKFRTDRSVWLGWAPAGEIADAHRHSLGHGEAPFPEMVLKRSAQEPRTTQPALQVRGSASRG